MTTPTLPDELGHLIVAAIDHYAREAAGRYVRETAERRRSVPLKVVAQENGMSLRRLRDACCAGRFVHVHDGDYRGMTPEHIDAMLAQLTVAARDEPTKPVDELEQARAASRRTARRQTPRRMSS